MLQSLVFTLDVHAGRTQKEIIKWVKRIVDLSKKSFLDLKKELEKLQKDTDQTHKKGETSFETELAELVATYLKIYKREGYAEVHK